MAISFVKMHGLGNDFVIIDVRAQAIDISAERIRLWADRRTGIGFDQIVLIEPPRDPDTSAFMRIYNADGSEVGACGNASRCVAKLLMQEGPLKLQTRAATLEAWKSSDKVTVDMGPVHLAWQEIPLLQDEDVNFIPVNIGELKQASGVNVGNPHAVFFVADVSAVPLETLGPQVEHHPLFPKRVNVEIAEVLAHDKLRMRVWERGVGITQACGTGACATVVAGVRRGLTARKAAVVLDGGTLDIEWRESDNHILMTGDAEEVYRGTINL